MQSAPVLDSVIPGHVPEARVWDHDVGAFTAALDDPFDIARILHDGPDIVWSSGCAWGLPGWLPTRFGLVDEVFKDHKRFTSVKQTGIDQMLGVDWPLNPIEIDPPEHGVYRRILQPWFQPSAIKARDAQLRAICDRLMDAFADQGACDFVADFSTLFPSQVFLSLMGMPFDQLEAFRELEIKFIEGKTFETRAEGARGIMRWMKVISEQKRAAPADDLISYIVTAELDGRLLDEGEVLGMTMLLYFGGLDTVISHLGWYVRHLALDPALQSRLRDNPAEIPKAADELSRLYGSTGTHRTVVADCDFHGVRLRAGDRIAVPVYLANRDPRVYERPADFELDRSGRHLTFAVGAHNCLGIHLARHEINIVIEQMLQRFDNIRIAPGGKVTWHTGGGSWGLDTLPLVWDAPARP